MVAKEKKMKKKIFLALLFAVAVSVVTVNPVNAASAGGCLKVAMTSGKDTVAGVEVEVMGEDKAVLSTVTSGENGIATFSNLKAGVYYYKVMSAPSGYTFDTSAKKVSIGSLEVRKIEVLTTTTKSADEGTEAETEVVKNYSLTTESNLREPSNLSAEEYDLMLTGTPLEGLGYAYANAEAKFGVNGLYLLGLSWLESSQDGVPGASKFARERNNLVGWGAADGKESGASYFESKESCIMHISEKLSENYLTEGGIYFNGYTPRAIDVKYCTDPAHADKIVNIVDRELKKVGLKESE